MNHQGGTNQELIKEISVLKQRIQELEQSESTQKRAEEEKPRSQEIADRLANEMAIIAEIGRVIGSTLDIDEVYDRFAAETKKLIPFDNLIINLIKKEKNELVITYVSGMDIPSRRKGDLVPFEGSIAEMSVRSGRGIILQSENIQESVKKFPSRIHVYNAGLRSMLSVPLISADKVFGVLAFRSQKPNAYTERDLRLAEKIGMQIAGAIANAQLFLERKQAEEKIQASLLEKEILLKEVHHRVKNNMGVISSLLNLKASSSENPEVIQTLEESNQQIHSMALIHEKLYGEKDWTSIDLGSYVTDMVKNLSEFYAGGLNNIEMKIAASGIRLSVDKAIPLGLILNELVSNAFKYAFPEGRSGDVGIVVRKTENGEIELIVRDNGVGLPKGFDPHKIESVGLYLVNGLAKNQLHGELSVSSEEGTEFRIRFPL